MTVWARPFGRPCFKTLQTTFLNPSCKQPVQRSSLSLLRAHSLVLSTNWPCTPLRKEKWSFLVLAESNENILSSPSMIILICGIKTDPYSSSWVQNCKICSSGIPNCSKTFGFISKMKCFHRWVCYLSFFYS